MGRYVAQKERAFFAQYAAAGKMRVAQLGGSWLEPSENIVRVPEDVVMKADAMAWARGALDMLLLPHSHEYGGCPLRSLAEASAALQAGGRLVLTGFNPHSLWYASGWFDGVRLPERRHCLALPDLKRHAQALGFAVEYGKFMVYLPPVKGGGAIRFWQGLEKAGDRWWPQHAAVYGLVLVKQAAGVHPLPECRLQTDEAPLVLGAVRVSDSGG
ncbi:methyltransferase [Bergeriella denitrificans]